MTLGEKFDPGSENRKDSGSSTDQWIMRAMSGLDARIDDTNKRFDRLDDRTRRIERTIWAVGGGVAVIAFLLFEIILPVVRAAVAQMMGG